MPVYVQHEILARVGDVFNAEALWQAPGLALFARRPLLRDLLERSPREQRGRAATRCFSHVTLMLPQDDVDDDRHLTRGARVRDLAQSLQALHQKDFGDLLGGDEVRYHVVGADAVAPGEVKVKFGHAVYLPAPAEQVLYTVTSSRDSAIWQPVCAVYPNQRLTLVGQDPADATFAVPGWPFGGEGGILLINDGADAPIEVQVRPKDALECQFDAANGYYVIRSKRGTGDTAGQRLLLKISRAAAAPAALAPGTQSAPPARAPSVWKPRAAVADSEMTAMPLAAGPVPEAASLQPENDATYAPVARHRITLAALALPRLSRYRDTGAQSLEVGLGAGLAPGAPATDSVIRFAVDDADEVHAITAAGRQRVTVPSQFAPLDGGRVQLHAVPAQMADRYAALLGVDHGPTLPAAAGTRLVFGRGMPALGALRVLDAPQFLRLQDGSAAASADRLGLSRNAFSWEAAGDGLRIVRLSESQALFHLDGDLQLVAQVLEATQDRPYLVPPGHHLVAGHYVLRFDA
ncbi:hypothetical protein [Massilia yuzhufengensis]|uniref:Uncharacterized protein n=1 Tax=Massilia yuzhufengensis TaxID=1164594 RepID=A0A1I1PNW1_9BURK|nr:hypothetical protein [Massilia yuzhufengensis]SFD11466.1 hypothetical protein SAMN05216204_11686 [Massilia yuzhufengensis]